jgi:hypothetical protein
MKVLTEKADLRCTHLHSGRITVPASQDWVTIADVPIPVDSDPVPRPVAGCNIFPSSACKTTFAVLQGYSELVRIGGKRICLQSLMGPTVAVPPGTFEVVDPGQDFVEEPG